ncbi:MAG: LacI family transcriptional regulator [Melioribacteraceae bacterium]|nr:LacI family transcriptional regulator [Melioribacteraceae bacterium]MCF8353156.1 LacI family transcriptional regulator [Melioribacteraceae bacterium]MCF8393144.1 LacI family transcriptional regulator [Melioribacteraceae bacterium]MCF8418047.1 LacI family transcriptional regulator [Melioribacteraceae bacterium]
MSIMTVSRALNNNSNVNDQTKTKVQQVAKKMGYIPNHIAKSLVQRKTFTIGVVVPEIAHSFFQEVIRGIEEIAYDAGYHIILTHSAESFQREQLCLETLLSKRVDGILLSVAETVTDFKIYKELIRLKMPMVFYDRGINDIGISTVGIDGTKAAEILTEHLIGLGYMKIAHLAGPLHLSIGANRRQGYLNALKRHKIRAKKSYIVEAGLKEKQGYEGMKKLLNQTKKNPPRAVVAVNDPSAFGAIDAIKEAGLRVPEDIAIVGFADDIRSQLIEVPLTTVRQPAYEVGKVAADKLIKHIESKTEAVEDLVLNTELIVRKSCGWSKKKN